MKRDKKQWITMSLLCLSICLGFNSCFPFPDYEKEQERIIQNFIAEYSDYNFEAKESGIYYCEFEEGVGTSPAANDTVSIRYSSYLLEHSVVDTDFPDEQDPADYVLGSGSLVQGVDEAITYMKKGGKAWVIVPSYLGYGNYTYYYDPYTPLIFYLELVDVKYYNTEK
jgi:FKBP-type peptidyl-prolyl cis-trans isomerase